MRTAFHYRRDTASRAGNCTLLQTMPSPGPFTAATFLKSIGVRIVGLKSGVEAVEVEQGLR